MSFRQIPKLLRQPTLENDCQVAAPATPKQTPKLPNGGPLLGFHKMVAPNNKNEGSKYPLSENKFVSRHVHELKKCRHLGAPSFPDLLRQILEGKQIQNKTIEDFLARNRSYKMYSSSFKLLWEVLCREGGSPPPGQC